MTALLNLIPGFSTLKGLAIGIVAGLVLGFTTGWRVHTWKDASAAQAVVVKVLKDTVVEQAQSQVIDQDVHAKSVTIENGRRGAIDTLTRQIKPTPITAPLLQPIPPQPAIPTHECLSTDLPALPAGAVGVLNRALNPGAPDPAGWTDAESRAATGIGLLELSVKLVDVAAQYHDLAARHDALVDWVGGEVKKRQ